MVLGGSRRPRRRARDGERLLRVRDKGHEGSYHLVCRSSEVSFRQECFTPHKLNHYNSVIGDRKGTPILFLVARATPLRGNFMNRLGRREADWVENMLIRQCLAANRSLLNVSGTSFAKEVVVPGVFRPRIGDAKP